MRLMTTLAAVLALSASAASLAAQDPTGGRPMAGGMRGMQGGAARRDPFARLLEHRGQLGLTAEQVSRIEAVRDRLRAQNQPLLARLAEARRRAGLPEPGANARGQRPTEEQREARRRFREANQPLLEQLRANARTAMREVRDVLTDQQRQQLRRMREHGERRHGARGGRMRHGGRMRRG